MKPKHQKYIMENISKKSIKEIAQNLHIREKKIRNFLKKNEIQVQKIPQRKAAPKVKLKVLVTCIVLIVVFGFAAYVNSLKSEFLWDDEDLVKNNVYIRSPSYLKDIFTRPIGAGVGKQGSFFRPIQLVSYMVDYSLWKLDVAGYHLTNTLLHVLVGLALFWLCAIIFKDMLFAFITSLLFVIHPLHTEAVSYIAGRADSLAFLFMLFAFIFYVKSLRSPKFTLYIAMVFSYIFALLSKELTLIFPLLLILFHYTFKEKPNKRDIFSIIAIALLYILLRITYFQYLLPDKEAVPFTVFQRFPGTLVAITTYLRLLVAPFHLHMWYGTEIFSYTDPKALLGVVIAVVSISYAIKKRRKSPLVFFSIFWYFTALLPMANIFMPVNAYMAEHWLYIPSIGFFLLLSQGLVRLYRGERTKIIGLLLMIGVAFFFLIRTIQQNVYWQESIPFYERTLKYAPANPSIYNNLGILYFQRGDKKEAVHLFKKALEVDSTYSGAYFNLGKAYEDMGKKEQAIAWYKKSLEANPDSPIGHNGLGLTLYKAGKHEEAIDSFKRAIELNPYYAQAHNNLGIVHYALGNHEQAITWYKKALKINPHFQEAYVNVGIAYYALGENEEAIAWFQRAIDIDPHSPKAYYNASVVCFEQKNYPLAIQYYDKAKELGFDNPVLSETLKQYRTRVENRK